MMNKSSAYCYFSILVLSTIFGLTGCQEELLLQENESTFSRVYNHLWGSSTDLAVTDDGGILMVGNINDTVGFNTSVVKVNSKGYTQWNLEISPYPLKPALTALVDGTYLISIRNTSQLIRIRENGDIIYNNSFSGSYGQFSKPLEQGNYLYISETGPGGYIIHRIDENGNGTIISSIANNIYVSNLDLTIASILDWDIYRLENDTAWLRATAILSTGGNFTYQSQIVLMLNIKTNSIIKANKLSTGGFDVNDAEDGRGIAIEREYVYTLAQESRQVFDDKYLSWANTFKVYKTDNQLDVVWIKEFTFGSLALTAADIASTDEGGVLICGTSASLHDFKPFLLKLDKFGNVIFTNMDFPDFFSGLAVKSSANGSVYMTGNAASRGKGTDKSMPKPFLIKTDNQGQVSF